MLHNNLLLQEEEERMKEAIRKDDTDTIQHMIQQENINVNVEFFEVRIIYNQL